MNKQRRYILISLVVLIAVAIAMYFFRAYSVNRDTEFAYTGKEAIQRIQLKDKNARLAILDLQGGKWIINRRYPAREVAVSNLMEAVNGMQVKYPVPEAGQANAIKEMLEKSVEVKAYTDTSDDPVRSYFIGGPTIDNQGTYAIMTKGDQVAERAYVLWMPGFDGYLTERFFTDEELWRSRKIMESPKSEIQKIRVEYPESGSGFIIESSDNEFNLRTLNNAMIGKLPMKARLDEYASYFEDASIEAFENTYPGKDSILKGTPFCKIELHEKSKKTFDYSFYYRPVDKRSKRQIDEEGNAAEIDVDRYFITFNQGKDFGTAQYYVFGKFFRQYNDFFESDSSRSAN